ncbi:MAG: uracil-DNA glycosylase family protein, partial [Betaproteobacteria bacterium]|nr:uracil-DNA glycosylase family protein [Betaproteobacteria bacterium]
MGMLHALIEEARACRLCAPHLPLGPRPVFLAGASARLLIVGQAPGRRVHETGIPWNDPSGEQLRAWLRMDRAQFYDTTRVAIVPAGLCYPGSGKRGDLPPRPECAPLWQPRFKAALPGVRLTLLVGMHAQAYHLGARRKKTLALTVRA